MIPVLAVLSAAVTALAAAPAPASAPEAGPLPIRRFALVAGANDGGPERVRLRYARSDAERVANVLARFGGVAPDDEILLLDPDSASLRRAFRTVEARIRDARATHRAELVVYYSGHADEQGLLLRGTHLPYQEVRGWLESVGAQVRIAIFDSCSSGALTRQKGGKMAAPFLLDTSSAVKGHAILTSSAADEASQESDRIGASFFTHFLVTGLRGAADATQDRKVTVNEAYQFAFGETLARTEKTSSGVQHPTYDIQLAGSGDVVLTDLRGTEASIVFPEQASGRFFVRDDSGRLVAELRKLPGRPIELGVEPGAYRIVREEGESLGEVRVAVASGVREPIPLDRVTPIRREPAAMRGGGEIAEVPVDLAVFPPLSLNGERSTENHLQLGLIGSRTTYLRGFGLGMVLWAEEDVSGMQLAAFGASARGRVDGVQLSGLAGVAGSVRGVQLSSIVSTIRGDLSGVQFSAVGSWLGGRAVGAQISPVMNYAGGIDGGQLGTVNVAGGVRGAQLGVVNVATHVGGAQLGVVNVANGPSVNGWQIGIVNVSRQVDGLPLGIVNVVRDGWHRMLIASDEDGNPTLAWAGGTGWFHTTLEVSLRRIDGEVRGWGAIGPGVHFDLGRLDLDLDLLAGHVMDEPAEYGIFTLRALATVPITRKVALVAGPTLNALGGKDRAAAEELVGPWGELTSIGGRPVWVGLQAGIRL